MPRESSSGNPFSTIPDLSTFLIPPPAPGSAEDLASSALPDVEESIAESLSFDAFDFDTLGSLNETASTFTSPFIALPFSELTSSTSVSPSSPVDTIDAQRRADLEGALQTRDIAIVLREVQKYVSLPLTDVKVGGITLPQQTTETYNLALRAMATVRPPGAPVVEILKAYASMIHRNVAPDVETYSIVIRLLCEREVEIQEAFAFEKELRRVPLLASEAPNFRAPPNLLPLPALHTFVNTPDFVTLREERNLDQAISLFTAASSFKIMASHPFAIEAYDALLKACAKAGRAADALRVFVDLEDRVGKEGGELGMTFGTWESMVEVYGTDGAMDASEDVFQEYRQAENDGRIVIREDRQR